MNVLANWVGLQNKARWQWITQMFHCGKSAICCASSRIVSQIPPCPRLPQPAHHQKQLVSGQLQWPLLHQLWGQQRTEWRPHSASSARCGYHGQVLLDLSHRIWHHTVLGVRLSFLLSLFTYGIFAHKLLGNSNSWVLWKTKGVAKPQGRRESGWTLVWVSLEGQELGRKGWGWRSSRFRAAAWWKEFPAAAWAQHCQGSVKHPQAPTELPGKTAFYYCLYREAEAAFIFFITGISCCLCSLSFGQNSHRLYPNLFFSSLYSHIIMKEERGCQML